jgi:hypothetical protein
MISENSFNAALSIYIHAYYNKYFKMKNKK